MTMGAMVVADLYQSAGCLPVNVRELGVDFATGGSVKWLCGGPGAGYLYVRRDLWDQLEPAATGWQAHQEPFGFEAGPTKFADRCHALSEWHAQCAGDVFGAIGIRDYPGRLGSRIFARSRCARPSC